MPNDNDRTATADTFTSFWDDFFAKLGAPAEATRGFKPPAGASEEATKHMQRIFLDAMAKYCDDFMRSEQFLSMMKQTMERSLAFKQQLDGFLANAQKGMQAPAHADINDLAGTLRKIEERVLDRLDALEKKAAAVEGHPGARRVAKASRAKRPSPRGVIKKAKRKK